MLALLAQGCTLLPLERTMVFRSPSGRAAIEVWQRLVDNSCGTQFRLVTVDRTTVLSSDPGPEVWVYFVHVYWSPDETKVGVTAAGLLRRLSRELACEVRTGKSIPFAVIHDDLAESIRRTYHVPPGEDPIDWTNDGHAWVAFSKLHPEIIPTYQRH
jgi:hypothetical protein